MDSWRTVLQQLAQSYYGAPPARIEPTMGRPTTPGPGNRWGHMGVRAGAGGTMDRTGMTPPADARQQGQQAVERALTPGARAEPTATGDIAGLRGGEAVDAEMDKALTEQWRDRMQASKASRARAGQAGAQAVRGALRPADIRALIQQMMAYTPEESAGMAQALGHSAVEGALGSMAPAPYPATSPPSAYTTGLLAIPPDEKTFRVYHGAAGGDPKAYGGSGAWVASTPEYARDFRGGPNNVFYTDVPLSELPPSIREQYELNGIPPTHFQLTPEQTQRLQPMPMTPPGQTFGPQSVVNPETESTQGTGYAPGSARAAHYGLDAVRRELLDKEPE